MASAPRKSASKKKPRGLAHWMRKTLEESDKVQAGFAPDPVHDLRVAIRRCRSLADGFIGLDPDPDWKRMKKAGKALFSAMGELRDVQVMREWVEKIGQPGEDVSQALLAHIDQREKELRAAAMAALDSFDRQQWRKWCRSLPARARRLPLESLAFQHMALERWEEARKLHISAMRSGSPAALHRLRIGLKRFRYTLENFLPRRHHAWGKTLARLQDLLGEVHDLDVLWETAERIGAFRDAETQARWRAKIQAEQSKRVDEYRATMSGKTGLWAQWRAGLPRGEKLRAAGMAKLAAWASFRDPEFRKAKAVLRLAIKIYDSLQVNGAKPEGSRQEARSILQAAALVRDVGRIKSERQHQKQSYKQIAKLEPPLGWSGEDLRLAALAARYHRGALPQDSQKTFHDLNPSERRETTLLAGILRLAERLGGNGDNMAVRIANGGPALVLEMDGFDERSPLAAKLARDRYLLELACGKPVLIRNSRQ